MRHYNYVLTCYGCPEQYDVWDDEKHIKVAYIRFRWGYLAVHPYKPETFTYINQWNNKKVTDQEIDWYTDIYTWETDDELLGILPDDKKDYIIDEIDKAIFNYWTNLTNNKE